MTVTNNLPELWASKYSNDSSVKRERKKEPDPQLLTINIIHSSKARGNAESKQIPEKENKVVIG